MSLPSADFCPEFVKITRNVPQLSDGEGEAWGSHTPVPGAQFSLPWVPAAAFLSLPQGQALCGSGSVRPPAPLS